MRLNPLGQIVQECWLAIPDHFPHALLDEFVIMPNHLHGIIVLQEMENSVGARRARPGFHSYDRPFIQIRRHQAHQRIPRHPRRAGLATQLLRTHHPQRPLPAPHPRIHRDQSPTLAPGPQHPSHRHRSNECRMVWVTKPPVWDYPNNDGGTMWGHNNGRGTINLWGHNQFVGAQSICQFVGARHAVPPQPSYAIPCYHPMLPCHDPTTCPAPTTMLPYHHHATMPLQPCHHAAIPPPCYHAMTLPPCPALTMPCPDHMPCPCHPMLLLPSAAICCHPCHPMLPSHAATPCHDPPHALPPNSGNPHDGGSTVVEA